MSLCCPRPAPSRFDPHATRSAVTHQCATQSHIVGGVWSTDVIRISSRSQLAASIPFRQARPFLNALAFSVTLTHPCMHTYSPLSLSPAYFPSNTSAVKLVHSRTHACMHACMHTSTLTQPGHTAFSLPLPLPFACASPLFLSMAARLCFGTLPGLCTG